LWDGGEQFQDALELRLILLMSSGEVFWTPLCETKISKACMLRNCMLCLFWLLLIGAYYQRVTVNVLQSWHLWGNRVDAITYVCSVAHFLGDPFYMFASFMFF
jgi:hypothetical protein